MITINGENELVLIESYAQLLARPRFLADLDPAQHKLVKLIGIYTLPEKPRCGLKDCHTEHNRGYLGATEDGIETNIGNVCGRAIFGIDNFNLAKRKLSADLREIRQREVLHAFRNAIPVHRQAIADLCDQPYGIDWAHRTLKNLGLPSKAWAALETMSKSNDGRLVTVRKGTEEEIAREQDRTQKPVRRPFYIEVQVGTLQGVAAMRGTRRNLSDLVKPILSRLDTIAAIDPDTAREHVVAIESKWVSSEFDPAMDGLRKALDDARRFLTKSNLSQFLQMGLDSEDQAVIRRTIASLPHTYEPPGAQAA